jgi:hypothetical protein
MIRNLAITGIPLLFAVLASCGSNSSNSANGGGGSGGGGEGSGESATDDGGGGSSASGSSTGSSSSGIAASGGSGSSTVSDASSESSSGEGSGSGSGSVEEGGSTGDASVYQMHNHINRDGLFVDSAFSKSALMGMTLKLDPTFAGTVSGNTYASPLYVQDGVNHKGTFYVATESNNVYALDETTGMNSIPSKNAGTVAQSTGCAPSNIRPLGITGTPAIDPTTRLIVFDAATAASAGGVLSKHTIHAWSIDDFTEKWSLDVSTLKDAADGAFASATQNQRSAVLIVGGIAYVTYGGHYGDCEPYYGWIVGVPLAATSATAASMAKFYATPAREAGMWAPGGPSSDGTSIFMATGNTPDIDPSGTAWKGGYSILRFGPGPTFTAGAANYWHAVSDDTNGDDDLGGTAPLVVDAPAITPSALLVQMGKDKGAYVVNRTNMGGEMSPLAHATVMNGEIINVAAWANTSAGTFIAMVNSGGAGGTGCKTGSGNLAVMQLSATAQISVPWCANNQGGGSPSITSTSADGTGDTLVWSVGTDGAGAGSGQIHAWDLATGTPVVMGSDTMANTRHFTTPIFVHGRAFAVGDGRLYALKP